MSRLIKDGLARNFLAGAWVEGDGSATIDRDALDSALLAAHAEKDTAALITLYTEAANLAEQAGDADAACFYFTHAFVFALESGAPEAASLNKILADRGRAKLLDF